MDQGIELSEAQRRIVDHDAGHLRIIACPGSGKTETVSRRVAELVRKGVEPSGIVAFTFTERAAESLKFRIRGILEETGHRESSDLGGMYIGTIDSFCLHMLKRLRPEYRSFEILDDARRIAFMDRWYLRIGLKDLETGTQGKWKTLKNFRISMDIATNERVAVSAMKNRRFAQCYEKYAEALHEERFFDFVSIIRTLLETLEGDPDALGRVNGEVKHVVFDEYQDVNGLQEELLEYLSRGSDSVCVVGDDDQNIFQWRGSNTNHIRDFTSKYSKYGAATEKLGTNYRSTDALVGVASRLISNNGTRVPKEMRSDPGQRNVFERGDIVHHHFATDVEEFGYICDTIKGLHNTAFNDRRGRTYPLSYRDMAVLVSTNKEAARISGFMSDRGVPCVADSGTNTFDVPTVSLAADCISYVFGHAGYGTNKVPDPDALADRYSKAVPNGDVRAFRTGLESVRRRAEAISAKGDRDWLPDTGLQEFYHRILSAMGAERGALSDTDMYSLAVLSRAISDYEYVYRSLRVRQVGGLKWFITQFARDSYADPARGDTGQADAVRIMTIWKAKGLEFPAVFVPSLHEQDRWTPPPKFVDADAYDAARYAGGEEADRRAYYVAVTRSRKYLFLTGASAVSVPPIRHASGGGKRPHPFVKEMSGTEFEPAASPLRRPACEGGAGVRTEGGLLATSYSRLSVYGRCPYEYRLRHVMGFDPGVPAAFGYGANIHNILNRIHDEFIRLRRIPDDSRIRDMFDGMFHMRFASGAQSENMKRAGIRAVGNYVRLCGADFERILDTEKGFEFRLDGAMISGSIDLLKRAGGNGPAQDVEITDFKTDKGGPEGAHAHDHSEQVRLYAYAVRESFGYGPGGGAIVHYLDTQQTERVDTGEAQLLHTREGISAKIGMIASGRFEPAPEGQKCGRCDFRALCRHKGFELGPDFAPAGT